MGGAQEHHFAAEYNASSELIQRWKSGSIYRHYTELRKVERFVFFLHNAVLQIVWNLSFADYQKTKKDIQFIQFIHKKGITLPITTLPPTSSRAEKVAA